MIRRLKPYIGIALCIATAVLLTALLREGADLRITAPAICLQVVIVSALKFGRVSALVGSLAASLTFAVWLFPPFGTIAINDTAERMMLLLFQALSLIVVFFAPRRSSHPFRTRS